MDKGDMAFFNAPLHLASPRTDSHRWFSYDQSLHRQVELEAQYPVRRLPGLVVPRISLHHTRWVWIRATCFLELAIRIGERKKVSSPEPTYGSDLRMSVLRLSYTVTSYIVKEI